MLACKWMPSESMPFLVEDFGLKHGGLSHNAMVIIPKQPMILGRDRIKQLRGPSSLSRVDRWLLEQASRRRGRNRVILFRACNREGERVWQFDPGLSDAELEEAGYLLTCALLPFHRRLLHSGVVLMVHTDWGLRECYAMRHGVRRLGEELKSSTAHAESEVRQVDSWLLGNMLLHVALSFNHVAQKLLPLHLSMLERRWSQLQPLLAQLPAHAVD